MYSYCSFILEESKDPSNFIVETKKPLSEYISGGIIKGYTS